MVTLKKEDRAMRKRIILTSLLAVLAVGVMASVALAGPRVAIVKASDAEWDLVVNSWKFQWRLFQDPPGANVPGNIAVAEWSKESEVALEKMTRKAVSLAGGWPVKRGDRVLIKVNTVGHCWLQAASGFGSDGDMQGDLTDARVARAAALMALESGAKEVIICNSPAVDDGWSALRQYGFIRMVEELNNPKVRLVDLGREPWKWYPAPQGLALDKYAMPKIIGEADKIINIGPMKTHRFCAVTSLLKNTGVGFPTPQVYGAPKHGLPHKKIAEVIVDVNMIAPSDYGIVEGIWGGEGFMPVEGPGVPMGIIMAGKDCVACDAVATVVMGFKVENIGTTVLAQEMGLGTYHGIQVVGVPIAQVQKAFCAPVRAKRMPAAFGNVGGWDSMVGRTLPD